MDEIILTEEVKAEEISHAESSAQNADAAAIAATAAAVNQAQIIGFVTETAREDAERARADAELSAEHSEAAAEIAAISAETAILEIRHMMSDWEFRLSTLEKKASEKVVVQESDGISNINPAEPAENENSDREESMRGGEEEEKSSKTKRHGRKRR